MKKGSGGNNEGTAAVRNTYMWSFGTTKDSHEKEMKD